MDVFFSKDCLEYKKPGHPESPQRVVRMLKSLKRGQAIHLIEAKTATGSDLLLAHTKTHINTVKENSFTDPDSPNYSNIYSYAKLSAGAAVQAASHALKNNASSFSLMRPPGHHAGRESVEGFCYFNNIAIATLNLLKKGIVKRVAILDIDAHHGNGTQNIVKGNSNIIYCSLHQQGIYPHSGIIDVKNCHNFPLAPHISYGDYKQKLEDAIQIIKFGEPDLLGVSLGFDTYKGDPLTQLNLKLHDFSKIGERIKQLNLPTFFVLEGGYSDKVGECAKKFFKPF